ncbi:MAG: hypothetical protein JRI68_21910 [Deltaproteobacteria bacterium]|nr:hypothetical protein [Deltaproteobacteria bacterium]
MAGAGIKDIWAYAIERRRAGDTEAGAASWRRGRVLRVKGGYNPNSSSVGSSIPMFLTLAAGSGALAVVLLNAMGVVGRLLRKQAATDGSGAAPAAREPDAGEPRSDPPDDEPPGAAPDEDDA